VIFFFLLLLHVLYLYLNIKHNLECLLPSCQLLHLVLHVRPGRLSHIDVHTTIPLHYLKGATKGIQTTFIHHGQHPKVVTICPFVLFYLLA